MSRKPRAFEAGDDLLIEPRETMEVLDEENPHQVHTGLLDASGRPIVRTVARQPIGFMRG